MLYIIFSIFFQLQADGPPDYEESVFDSGTTANTNPFLDDFFTQVCEEEGFLIIYLKALFGKP